MVSWGPNQVFSVPGGSNSAAGSATTPLAFGSSAPAPASGGLFGAPASSGGGMFGSPAPAGGGLFGASAPAPATGGLFGAPPPATSGGLFGTPAPAGGGMFGAPAPATGGLFGAPAPAGGGMFGAPAPATGGLFGAPAPAPSSLFGTPTPAPQQYQIPAQAALQAHADASARQEAAKIQSSLESLYNSYNGVSNSSSESSPFVSIVYNDMTPEQLQWHFAHSQAGSLAIPPKPPQVSEKDWLNAVVRNPNPTLYLPMALVGAEALQARLGWQQERAHSLHQGVELLEATRASVEQRVQQYKEELAALVRIHMGLNRRLLETMRKVEIVRCMNIPFQDEEINAMERLVAMRRHIEQVGAMLDSVRNAKPPILQDIDLPDKTILTSVLTEHYKTLVQLSEVVQKDKRDVTLLKERERKQNTSGLRHKGVRFLCAEK